VVAEKTDQAPPAAPRLPHFIGLDLGQAQDFSALVVARKTADRYDLLSLRRWPLGTAYPVVVADVGRLLAREETKGATLAIDYTGAGRPVADMFAAAGMEPTLIAITAGNMVTRADRREWHVPKRDLAAIVAVLLQEERLKWPAKEPLAPVLARELADFRVKVSLAGNDLYGAWREGAHDDLVLATAIACWAGENTGPPAAGSLPAELGADWFRTTFEEFEETARSVSPW